MALFYKARIIGDFVKIDKSQKISEVVARDRIKKGQDVWGARSNAGTLAKSLCDGQGNVRDSAHVIGGFKHYHDVHRRYRGHIFYGEPSKE